MGQSCRLRALGRRPGFHSLNWPLVSSDLVKAADRSPPPPPPGGEGGQEKSAGLIPLGVKRAKVNM